MPALTVDQLTYALAVVAAVAVVALILFLVQSRKLRELRREYAILRSDGDETDILALLRQVVTRADSTDRRIDEVVAAQQEQAAIGRFALQKSAIVRYDAFGDMGGELSFSAAFLDEHGDGVVITSINGRTETRTYGKEIKQLTSPHGLSDEEREVVSVAAGYGHGEVRDKVSSR